jgi:protein-L-isoaspartate(D-aspartate) O-methyltransferase
VKTPDWNALRTGMIEKQLQSRRIVDPRVLDAMRRMPRHLFVPDEVRNRSYEDRALSIGCGQTISQPFMVAIMLQALGLNGYEKVLEIGTGTGYQAALLGLLARQVETVEIIPELAAQARTLISAQGLDNVHIHVGDASAGWPQEAPFDAIIMAAGAPEAPPALAEQLASGGQLLIPLGDRKKQILTLFRKECTELTSQSLGGCSFVPLRGAYGWTTE